MLLCVICKCGDSCRNQQAEPGCPEEAAGDEPPLAEARDDPIMLNDSTEPDGTTASDQAVGLVSSSSSSSDEEGGPFCSEGDVIDLVDSNSMDYETDSHEEDHIDGCLEIYSSCYCYVCVLCLLKLLATSASL